MDERETSQRMINKEREHLGLNKDRLKLQPETKKLGGGGSKAPFPMGRDRIIDDGEA